MTPFDSVAEEESDDVTDDPTGERLDAIAAAFTEGDYDSVKELVRQGLDDGLAPQALMDGGLVRGIREVGELFRLGEAFLPEMMLAAEAWEEGMAVLQPHLAAEPAAACGTVVIGTVKGDIHSLGKNIVTTMLRTAGFEVVDLGVDVQASRFVTAALEAHADAIAVTALMTTTMPQQREVIEHLVASGHREDVAVLVGGASTTQAWADEIGADGHGETAADAVSLAEEVCGRSRRSA
jgi:5-methyltetrahydrofolate--homocysteine methyltransferase